MEVTTGSQLGRNTSSNAFDIYMYKIHQTTDQQILSATSKIYNTKNESTHRYNNARSAAISLDNLSMPRHNDSMLDFTGAKDEGGGGGDN